jgi:hypothetical protein
MRREEAALTGRLDGAPALASAVDAAFQRAAAALSATAGRASLSRRG